MVGDYWELSHCCREGERRALVLERAEHSDLVGVAKHLLFVALGEVALRDSRVVDGDQRLVLRPEQRVLVIDLGLDSGEVLDAAFGSQREDDKVTDLRRGLCVLI